MQSTELNIKNVVFNISLTYLIKLSPRQATPMHSAASPFCVAELYYHYFSTLYTTFPHNLIKDKLVNLIERIFLREGSLYIACNDNNFFDSMVNRIYPSELQLNKANVSDNFWIYIYLYRMVLLRLKSF